ncbi:MAG: dihydroneopterin aldolase [Bacteroidaceae bacterium]|nr:dihydroneopterin aldolase [Bacteroidaceae bacterium]
MNIESLSVKIRKMKFFAYHGAYPEERQKGGSYTVTLELELAGTRAAESDQLTDTVDYAEVYDLVRQTMVVPSNIIEHVAARIAQTVLDAFPLVKAVTVKLVKDNPPITGANFNGSAVQLRATR